MAILVFIIILSILVILHELGHFLMAKRAGIGVEEFGIGLPPRIWGKKIGETIYSVNWLPFGGFCRMKGETDPTVPGGFMTAGPWKRIAVLVAGPFMNLLAAVVMYAVIISMIGMPQLDRVEVKDVAPGSPADVAGLKSGDLILKLDETNIDSTEALSKAVGENIGKEVSLYLQRGSKYLTVSLTPRLDRFGIGHHMIRPHTLGGT